MHIKATANVTKCSSQPCYPYLCIDAPNSPTGYVCQCGSNDFRTTSCKSIELFFVKYALISVDKRSDRNGRAGNYSSKMLANDFKTIF